MVRDFTLNLPTLRAAALPEPERDLPADHPLVREWRGVQRKLARIVWHMGHVLRYGRGPLTDDLSPEDCREAGAPILSDLVAEYASNPRSAFVCAGRCPFGCGSSPWPGCGGCCDCLGGCEGSHAFWTGLTNDPADPTLDPWAGELANF